MMIKKYIVIVLVMLPIIGIVAGHNTCDANQDHNINAFLDAMYNDINSRYTRPEISSELSAINEFLYRIIDFIIYYSYQLFEFGYRYGFNIGC